ncbi:MAG: hypothetical protein K9K79_10710, partial [Desulfohalobiaceae bacterium]|nr:hypothetical protein [Desulfohalobiaceae bacterium]
KNLTFVVLGEPSPAHFVHGTICANLFIRNSAEQPDSPADAASGKWAFINQLSSKDSFFFTCL